MKFMRLVIIESPYAGDIEANVEYARAAVRDSLSRGEAPIASHLLYTQPGVLRDEVPSERQWGIDAGLAWRHVSDATIVYIDRGMSKGMEYGLRAARDSGKPVEFRRILGGKCQHEDVKILSADSSGIEGECRICGASLSGVALMMDA